MRVQFPLHSFIHTILLFMTATLDRADVIKRYELMNIEQGAYKVVPVEKLSTEFMKARIDFAEWYDSKPEEIQFLIDEISDRTSFIIDEAEYDEFIEVLADYGITTAEQFEDRFNSEYEGYGEHIYAKFAEEWCDDTGLNADVPELFVHAIDYGLVYYQNLQYDFVDVDFRGNRYFFYNH